MVHIKEPLLYPIPYGPLFSVLHSVVYAYALSSKVLSMVMRIVMCCIQKQYRLFSSQHLKPTMIVWHLGLKWKICALRLASCICRGINTTTNKLKQFSNSTLWYKSISAHDLGLRWEYYSWGMTISWQGCTLAVLDLVGWVDSVCSQSISGRPFCLELQ